MLDAVYLVVLPAARLILTVLWYLLVIRAVLSWLPAINNTFTDFVYSITEAVINPVRNITNRFGGGSMPIDLAYLVVVIIVVVLMNVL